MRIYFFKNFNILLNLHKRKMCENQFKKKTVNLIFIERDGTKRYVKANIGEKLMDIALKYDIGLECACGGELACSTCHIVFSPDWEYFHQLPPKTEDEIDMLDMVPKLENTSRLGCQIKVNEHFEGQEIKIPE